MGKLFGTDGVRGIANAELTPEMAFILGRAATYFFGKEHAQPVFIIGRDTRISGHMLECALAAGICSAGGKAIAIGIAPTPAVAYLSRKLGAQAGVVISASHNPFADNGIKFFAGNGYKLPDAAEEQIEALVLNKEDVLPRPTGDKIGIVEYRPELVSDYEDFVISTVKGSFNKLTIVVDCANGAASRVAPAVLKRLGAKVIVLNDSPDGVNINKGCGSTHLHQLQEAVLEHKADIGIGHDGDADRCLAVDEQGNIVDGDQIMVICALNLMRDGQLKDNTLVTTVMSNIGLHRAIKEAGGKVIITPVGDRYVLEEMLEHGYVLGGEQSGHIIFSAYNTTGDGVLTALKLIEAVNMSDKKLSELAALMTRYPQVLVNVRVKSKQGWQENKAIANAISAGDSELADNGRILVRPSGTEPLIRVMAEGPDLDQLHRIVNTIADTIRKEQS